MPRMDVTEKIQRWFAHVGDHEVRVQNIGVRAILIQQVLRTFDDALALVERQSSFIVIVGADKNYIAFMQFSISFCRLQRPRSMLLW